MRSGNSNNIAARIGRTSLHQALHAWSALLGCAAVLHEPEALRRYDKCTGTDRQDIPAALQPQTAQDVAGIVKIAAQFRVPLYPISTGRNWGYGSANPTAPGCVIVDLGGLDRIVDFDPELGLVTLEPGVTQQQLAQYLERHGHRFMTPTTGAGPTCSLVGNALERGYGITPGTDHFAAVTSLEAVLPDGRIYRPALDELGAVAANRAFKWGLGPYLDGLFAQGNFGIVTQMTIALAKSPAGFKAFYFSAAEDDALENLADATREIMARLPGIVGSINLMNQHRVLAMTTHYPKDLVGANGVLPKEAVTNLGKKHQVMAWTGVGALYGEPEVVAAAETVVRKLLGPASKRLLFLTPERARLVRRIAGLVPGAPGQRLRKTIDTLNASLQLMLGHPNEVALPLAYWKNGGVPAGPGALDPAADGCGLIWYPPLVPMRRGAVREYVTHVQDTCAAHGIEPLITLTALSDRCFDSTVPVLFERNNAMQAKAAERCYQALFEDGLALGFVPYRLGPQAMRRVADSGSVCWDIVAKLKAALDPGNIVAPGRYAPLARE